MNWYALRYPVHVSWLIAWLAVGIVSGVAVSAVISSAGWASISWLFAGILFFVGSVYKRIRYMLPIALLAGMCIGVWRGASVQGDLSGGSVWFGQEVRVSGVIAEDPDVDASGRPTVRLKTVTVNDEVLPGSAWLSLRGEPDIQRSDRLVVTGNLQEGFGGFSAAMFRAEVAEVERPVPGDVALRVRDWFADAVRQVIPEPEASLGLGYLLGQRRALPLELDEALRIAGLTHAVVASGYNLTILVRFARRLFVKVSKYLSALAAGGMIVSFIAITGMSASMSRAGLVAGVSLLAWYYGRRLHPLVLLPSAAAVTVLINPSYAWGDVAWQLSFAAFAGVMILAPYLQRYFFGEKKPSTVRQIMGETISAQIATLPILVLTFGAFSNVAVVANLLVLPLVPLAMLLTFFAGIGALLLPGLTVIGLPAAWLLGYMTDVAMLLSAQPWAMQEVTFTVWHALGFYVVLVGACVYMWRKTGHSLRDNNIVE